MNLFTFFFGAFFGCIITICVMEIVKCGKD